ncbi:hypothetical protein VNO80_26097 [Phaseolus coccineus]|uniref:Proline-rich protein n=1 Tax=Phaseolus coccineus TaxID=3886 RepID=A0AAN9LZ04_PHACN
MTKGFTLQCALLFFFLATFSCAPSVLATTQITGNEVNGKVSNEEFAKASIEGHDEEAKFKGFFPKPMPIAKQIPVVKPIPKIIPVVKPVPVKVYKPVPKLVPIVKPIPILKPIPKPIPILKPIPKPVPILKPIPKPIPFVKEIPKPFIVKKPIPSVESEEFLKPNNFFKKPIPKLPLDPKFKKPLLPPLPILKPIPTP